ncbi:oxidoreductase [Devosia pacifica]|uniref:Oxidoreductase n=1 Tax=Devosia pacifica TaxID=1335967 RepID=A0A918SHF0_9HYPH|nr:alcohol dehydrogenase catalytic domain-containing protein [Devosia pacifica]GHA39217.1 oxidoreductase [Devosia pacifica]
MSQMQAVFLPGNKQVEVRSVAVPEVGPDDVLVEMHASCICRSDLSLYYGSAVVGGGAATGGFVCGHEPAGTVVAVGEAVTEFNTGDRVAVYLAIGCGVCEHCRRGDMHLCPKWKCLGFTTDGGNAEYLKVPAQNLLKVPASMSPIAAAISTDAFGTLFSACRKVGVNGLSRIGIWGLGPMGSSGVLAARALGGQVVALDPIAERRAFAASLGADLVLDPLDPQAGDKIQEFSGGHGLTGAIDCSGNTAAHNMALDALAPLGRMAFVGENAETTIHPSNQLIRKQVTVFGSWYFGINEYQDILRTIEGHGIDLERLATHTFKLEEAETAFRMFDERQTEKAVFVR